MTLFFYIFSILMISAAIMVIVSRNPVHTVLWLIFTFCNGSGLMVLLGSEFIAMMLIIIYVGAVAVLFLFVIMMLDLKSEQLHSVTRYSKILVLLLSGILFADLSFIILISSNVIEVSKDTSFAILPGVSNSHIIGKFLYTDFILPFQIAGIILFVAMVASIALTLRSKPRVTRQNISNQLLRNKRNSIEIIELEKKLGVKNLHYDN